MVAAIAGALAYSEGLPKAVVLLIAVSVLALAMLAWAGWRIWRSIETEFEEERLYKEELARRRAISRAAEQAQQEEAGRRFSRMFGFGNITEIFAEHEKDRKAEAEARRQRLIWEASQPPPPPAPPPTAPPVQEEPEGPAPEEELEKGLYVGSIVLDATKMETQHLIEIGIVGFNGSGRAACVSSVRGLVKVFFKTGESETIGELHLPTPRLLTDRSNIDFMPSSAEFLIVLEQVLRPGVPEQLVAGLDYGQLIFDLDNLEIQMKSCRRDEPDVFARLKLWNGAVLRRASGFSTHRQHKLTVQAVTTAVSSGEADD
jgi:hypothetical protein